ncbi:MAG: cytochrome c-type biogenesis protein CcmH [Gemmatimonadota bacterium]
MSTEASHRRTFLKVGLAVIAGAAFTGPAGASAQQDSLSGEGATGTLRDPYSTGRPLDRVTPADNDATVQRIEHQLKCSCGCNLDIFTCRTTDFTCTTSPRLHKEVVGLLQSGLTEDKVIDQFVVEYGEQALMAPKPVGFNIAGYVVPGAVIAIVGTTLALYLSRRRTVTAAEGITPAPIGHYDRLDATPEELARLRSEVSRDDG